LQIIILADGNNKIGMGHVYRALNLSSVLKKNGHKIIFLTKEPFTKRAVSKTNECKLIQKLSNNRIQKFLKKKSPDIIIIDKLNETKKNLITFKKFCPIIGIDYTGKHKELFDCGINILYPKSGISKKSFSSLDYAIFNEKFKQIKKKKIRKEIRSILILQGGADTYCFTPKIIKAVYGLENNFKISVILGPSFNCWSRLNHALKKMGKPVKIYHNVKNMPFLMRKYDLAITAAGNTLLELAYLGIPSVIICAERFEIETAKLLESKGFGIHIGFGKDITSSKIRYQLMKLVKDYSLRKKMNRMGPKLIDGKGSSRILKILCSKIK